MRIGRRYIPYFFIAPSIALLAVFQFFPLAQGLVISFNDWSFLKEPVFAGLRNYGKLLGERLFWRSMSNTAVFTIGSVPTGMALSLLAALVLNQRFPLRGLVRSVFFFPVVISMAAVALTWQFMFSTYNGIVNLFLGMFGVREINWMGSGPLAMGVVIFVSVWKHLGWNMMIFIAGLQTIPTDYYEAAMIDGASPMRRFASITLPLLRPTILFILITSIISSFKVFDVVYVMTQGGPLYATMTIVQYIYRSAFVFFEMGYASATAYVLFVGIIILTVVQMKFLGRPDE